MIPCFIIASYYVRSHKTYIKTYVDRINKFYTDSFVIIVDNGSKYIEDVEDMLKEYTNDTIVKHNLECRFEIGAYKCGINYLKDNNLLDKYEYVVFSQDTFVINRYFDFNILAKTNTVATSFNHLGGLTDMNTNRTVMDVFDKLNITDKYDGKNINLTWCNSFILHKNNILPFYEIVKDIVVLERFGHCGSVQTERYLSGIMYYLNNYKSQSICGNVKSPDILGYDCWNVDIENNSLPHYFVKEVQQKTEKTVDE